MEENKENVKYMIQAMNEMCESIDTFIRDCFDDVEKVGADFHKESEEMTLEEAIKDLDIMCSNFKQCYLANEELEHTTIIDIVIAAAIVFKKLEIKKD